MKIRNTTAGPLLGLAALGCGQSGLESPAPTTACLAVPVGIGTVSGDSSTPDRILLTFQGESAYGHSVTLVDETNDFEFLFDPTLRIVHVDGTEEAREGDTVEVSGQKQDPAVPGTMGWCGDLTRIGPSGILPVMVVRPS